MMSRSALWPLRFLALVGLCSTVLAAERPNARQPTDDADLRRWLENMVWHHRFTVDEITAATGLSDSQIDMALDRFDIRLATKPRRPASAPLLVLPYPGGRHPRIGFLDGAIDPQRETKVSVFTPWDERHYVVLDIPEAIWWQPKATDTDQRELLYLAHTHIETTWTKQGVDLAPTEWSVDKNGTLQMTRTLPNGVAFGTTVVPAKDAVGLEMRLCNNSEQTLTGLDVQACVMFKGAPPFAAATNDNKVFSPPYVACRNQTGDRWVITAWTHCQRAWANPPCPCMHSDPQFPDCEPGQTVRVRGWLSFYQGDDIHAELRRIDQLPWKSGPLNKSSKTDALDPDAAQP